MFRPPMELQKNPMTVQTATIDRQLMQNFQDRVGPAVSADWLNTVASSILDLQRRVAALEAASGQVQVASTDTGGDNVSFRRGPPGPPNRT